MEVIRELLVSLGLEVEQAEWVEAIGLEHLLEKATEELVEILKEIPAQMIEAVMETAEFGEEMEKASERTGLTTDRLQELGYIGKLSGLTMSDMEVAMGHLSRTMDMARNGGEEAQKMFAKLGVRVTDSNGKLRNVNDVLNDVADGIHRLPPGAERMSASMETMGRSGRNMINVLGGGSEKLKELTGEFHELGGGIDEEGIKRAAAFAEGLKKLQAIGASLAHEFAGPLIEALGPVLDEFIEWYKANGDLIRQGISKFAGALAQVILFLVHVFVGLGHAIGSVVNTIKKLWAVMRVLLAVAAAVAAVYVASLIPALWAAIPALLAQLVEYAFMAAALGFIAAEAVAAAWASADAWVIASAPVIAMVAALALMLLVLEDVYYFFTGGDSLLGRIGPAWTKFIDSIVKPNDKDPWWLAALKQALAIVTDLQGSWDKLQAKIGVGGTAALVGFVPGASVVSAVSKLSSSGEDGLPGGAASPDSAVDAQGRHASARGWTTNVTQGDQNNHIEIHAAEGQDTSQIGEHVAKKIDEHHAARVQEAIAAHR